MPVDSGRGRINPDAEHELHIIGADPAEVAELIEKVGEGLEVRLSGSLAVSLGNTASDLDLQFFGVSEDRHLEQKVFFVGERMVDVQYYNLSAIGETLDHRRSSVAETPIGTFSLGEPVGLKEAKRLSRWITGMPFYEGDGPILAADQIDTALPLVGKKMLEWALSAAGYAKLMQSGPTEAAWARAGWLALDVFMFGDGEHFVGSKWCLKKSRRSSLDRNVIDAFLGISDERSWEEAWSAAGCPPPPLGSRAEAVPHPATSKIRFLGQSLIRRGDYVVEADRLSDPAALTNDEFIAAIAVGLLVPDTGSERIDPWIELLSTV